MPLNQQQILALAPDNAAAQAGLQLAHASKWLTKHMHPLALWGDCQGSGKSPYKTYVDLTNIAFKCTCPSRKFPCKHGLGLLLLYSATPSAFTSEKELPKELDDWLNKRNLKETPREEKPVDAAAQLKRIESREKKIAAGINELQSWIKDVVRTGIKSASENPYQFNKNIIARMIDYQAPGLAFQLKKLNKINYQKQEWQSDFVRSLSKTYLIADAYKRKDDYDLLLREETDALIGRTKSKEDILKSEPVIDEWIVLFQSQEYDESLTAENTWLYGIKNKRFALLLDFFAGNQKPSGLFIPGTVLEGGIVFYPSRFPLRALVKEQKKLSVSWPVVSGDNTTELIKNRVAGILAIAPFTDRIPFILSDFTIILKNGSWYLRDERYKGLTIMNKSDACWNILAITLGNPFTCFTLYENEALDICSIWYEGTYYFIK